MKTLRTKQIMIREMTHSDLGAVVDIHANAFDGFFLTRMGPRFLRAYYQTVLEFESSIALVAYDTEADRAQGFAVGFRDPQGFYHLFGQRRRRVAPAILLAVLRNPGLMPTILHNIRRVDAQAQQPVNAVELSSIAVGVPRRGVGGALLEAFADKARSEGVHRLILTTDAEGNDPVREFYEARGFNLEGFETRAARQLCRYFREL